VTGNLFFNSSSSSFPIFLFLLLGFLLSFFNMAIPADANGATPVKAKVLVPEKVSPDGLALLQKSLEIHERKGLTPEQLIGIIPDYEALIVRSETKVTAQLLQAAKKLKVVARAGVGVDNVDVNAATKLGIIVVNSPSGNINAAAEHTVACEHFVKDPTRGTEG
jgi:D-3-phosphoglycerate dehydrogenase